MEEVVNVNVISVVTMVIDDLVVEGTMEVAVSVVVVVVVVVVVEEERNYRVRHLSHIYILISYILLLYFSIFFHMILRKHRWFSRTSRSCTTTTSGDGKASIDTFG